MRSPASRAVSRATLAEAAVASTGTSATVKTSAAAAGAGAVAVCAQTGPAENPRTAARNRLRQARFRQFAATLRPISFPAPVIAQNRRARQIAADWKISLKATFNVRDRPARAA